MRENKNRINQEKSTWKCSICEHLNKMKQKTCIECVIGEQPDKNQEQENKKD